MKKSAYKSIFHLYFIFFFLLIITIAIGITMLFYTITIHKSNGQAELSNWPKQFTENFSEQIFFVNDIPQIKQTGVEQLQTNNLWLQIINENGTELLNYKTPQQLPTHYSDSELLKLYQTGGNSDTTAFLGNIQYKGQDFIYIIGFPVKITKVTMYVATDKFTGGKPILLGLMAVMFVIVLLLGIGYGYWITKNMSRITTAINEVSKRFYLPIQNNSSFSEVYDSLNVLDAEIRASDEMRVKNEKMRQEWITNITHDLKTPLSPIKGYAELIIDPCYELTSTEIHKYAEVILKNTTYAQALIDDLKLTYQLENEMIPVHKTSGNIVRFIKELIIDLLNHPDYETRNISFYSSDESIVLNFDPLLLKRAYNNLLINALIHTDTATQISVSIKSERDIQICIQDNGPGISDEDLKHLFIRYYRGTNTEQKTEGTGLGMAIAKQIIELHDGTITANSTLDIGTSFIIEFPKGLEKN
jgi:signal transduction histidine kinase